LDRIVVAALLLSSLYGVGSASAAAQGTLEGQSRACFKVFDATMYLNRPSLKADGLEPVSVLYTSAQRWPFRSKDDLPDAATIQEWLSKRSLFEIVVLDVEHWPLEGDAALIRQSLNKYRTLFSRVKAATSNRVIGFYSVPPLRDYWRAGEPTTAARYRVWQAENDTWQALADEVDVLFPSLYTFYNDPNGWVRYAEANLAEARRMAGRKPVYAFIWPQFHESNKTIGLTYVPASFWRLQLDTVAKHADGVAIWGGYRTNWNPQAEWWRVTKDFIRAKYCRVPSAPTQFRAGT
jgi:hypothetical protein